MATPGLAAGTGPRGGADAGSRTAGAACALPRLCPALSGEGRRWATHWLSKSRKSRCSSAHAADQSVHVCFCVFSSSNTNVVSAIAIAIAIAVRLPCCDAPATYSLTLLIPIQTRLLHPLPPCLCPCPSALLCSAPLPCSAPPRCLPMATPPPIPLLDTASLRQAALRFPPPAGVKFSYGTAGFRTDAALLPSTIFRMGVLAALRSICTQGITGLMLTASHNPVHENGVKLVDPSGGMLAVSWESYSDLLANAPDADNFVQAVEDIIRNEKIQERGKSGEKVLLGRDTRPSGQSLLEAAFKGVEAVRGVEAQDMGILTTPQLHWMVRCINKRVPATESDYFRTLSKAFSTLSDLRPSGLGECTDHENLIVDAANGVGADKLFQLQKVTPSLRVQVRNSGLEGEGLLNDGVGADFVQKEKIPPRGFDASSDSSKRCASLDGDADRLVYFYISPMEQTDATSASLQLLDGDKIATLFSSYIMDQLQILRGKSLLSGAIPNTEIPGFGTVKVAVIQTAYANGASTKYIKQVLGLEVALTPTGVKHLHKRAAQYDVGIYFEANGHGTILFSDNFLQWLHDAASLEEEGQRKQAARRLVAVSEMVNQAVGDALSSILMVESVLRYRNWSLQQWNALYTDLPSRQLKVTVADRSVFKTTDAETKVAFPSLLQGAIDTLVEKYEGGRAFVRPSGTEDVVRIYAEGLTQKSADALAREVAVQVFRLGGGTGEVP
ncbi:hypothetical protein M758_7G000100 [Ceratodon purpureus]|nr:hypothetical protein M758_7G000100 [Ceratodon purpureus]